ncbi:MAG: hypothetical protein GY847_32330, partial [Proteobacteria bacterium]|nr:hypothetical protein [Pseudomonadota bacterium]
IPLDRGQTRPAILENAFIYLSTRHLRELKLLPFADFQTEFMLYLNIALENGESWNICCHSTFEGDVPDSYKEYAKGTDPRHYYLRMPTKLAKLLDGTRVTVVVQIAKTLRMIYNMCGIFPINGESMTGRYGFEPDDHICYSWITNDELALVMYIDQFVLDQPIN